MVINGGEEVLSLAECFRRSFSRRTRIVGHDVEYDEIIFLEGGALNEVECLL